MRSSRKAWLVLGIIAVLGMAAFVALVTARFDSGESFPLGSTYLAGPQGTSALFETLERLPDVRVDRHLRPPHKLRDAYGPLADSRPTLYLLNRSFWPLGQPEIQEWVLSGGRLVLSLSDGFASQMEYEERRLQRIEEEAQEKANDGEGGDEASRPEDVADEPQVSPEAPLESPENADDQTDQAFKWVRYLQRDFGNFAGQLRRVPLTGLPDLAHRVKVAPKEVPANVFWISDNALGFPEGAGEDARDYELARSQAAVLAGWTPLLAQNGRVVAAERTVGRGEIVLLAGTYSLTNDALVRHRNTDWLAYLQGDRSLAVFDEHGLGTQQPDGFIFLLRRYGLTPFFLALGLLFFLFLWQSSVSLLPLLSDAETRPPQSQGSLHVMADLLRASVPLNDLLPTALAEWEKAFPRDRRSPSQAARLAEAQIALKEEQAKPARKRQYRQLYRRIAELLDTR